MAIMIMMTALWIDCAVFFFVSYLLFFSLGCFCYPLSELWVVVSFRALLGGLLG